jgi:hypothetical protein
MGEIMSKEEYLFMALMHCKLLVFTLPVAWVLSGLAEVMTGRKIKTMPIAMFLVTIAIWLAIVSTWIRITFP